MFDNLSNLGYGLVTFAIIIGVGSVVLYNFSGATASCGVNTWNATDNTCWNATHTVEAPSGSSYTTTTYLLGQMGTSGLAGWTPAIIAFSVGMLFLGSFFVGKGRKY